jgi:hypothetical protein
MLWQQHSMGEPPPPPRPRHGIARVHNMASPHRRHTRAEGSRKWRQGVQCAGAATAAAMGCTATQQLPWAYESPPARFIFARPPAREARAWLVL